MVKYSGSFFAAVVLLIATSAHAANISELVWKDGKTRITIEGDISAGDSDKLKAVIKSVNDAGRSVYSVRLNSPGGSLIEGVLIAELVKFARVLTAVPPSAKCASACFVIFAAGAEKFASHSALVGVHGASEAGQETARSGAATISMARVVKELGVPPSIIGKMVITPPDQVVWLTPDELRSMGVTMTGKPDQLKQNEHLQSQLPLSLSPQAKASAPPTWGELVKKTIEASQSQNNGRPRTARSCQPEFKICNTAVFVDGKDGKTLMVRTEENLAGKIITREFCELNSFGDVRTCVDWDTGAIRRDMKDKSGLWSQVSDD